MENLTKTEVMLMKMLLMEEVNRLQKEQEGYVKGKEMNLANNHFWNMQYAQNQELVNQYNQILNKLDK